MFAGMDLRTWISLCAVALLCLCAQPAFAEAIGHCRFDAATLSFAGSPAEQAECLLPKVERRGALKPRRLPRFLAELIDAPGGPSLDAQASAIALFPEPYRAYAIEHANDPVSKTEAGIPLAYFVIHDTSTPFLGNRPFPRHIDRDPEVNSFAPYLAKEPVAHIFLSRYGQLWPGHEFAQPWRATKLETRMVGVPARGRFVHIELMQPRRYARGSKSRGDARAPKPGFSKAQYRQLAALYVYVSARARRWLIPAFHAAVDEGIPEAHDDPQNFNLKLFVREVERLLKR
jgi:hypothetical protein